MKTAAEMERVAKMKKAIETIMTMLQSDRHSEVNAALNRIKGLVEDGSLGVFQNEAERILLAVRKYDKTRNDMLVFLKTVVLPGYQLEEFLDERRHVPK